MADEKRRLVFGRSLSEKLRCSTTGETVERIWMRLRQVKLQGSTTTHSTHRGVLLTLFLDLFL